MSNPRVHLTREAILRLLDGNAVQVPTSVGLLEFEAVADEEWQPLQQTEVPARLRAIYEATMGERPVEIWSNDTYEIIVRRLESDEDAPDQIEEVPPGGVHMSIKRYDRAPIHNWRHFQQMKNEIAGEECEAMEVYPAESRLVDNANQYHLWVLPLGVRVPVGFSNGMVIRSDEMVAEYNEMTPRGRQEPYQPGLTTGETMQRAVEEQHADPLGAIRALKEQGLA